MEIKWKIIGRVFQSVEEVNSPPDDAKLRVFIIDSVGLSFDRTESRLLIHDRTIPPTSLALEIINNQSLFLRPFTKFLGDVIISI